MINCNSSKVNEFYNLIVYALELWAKIYTSAIKYLRDNVGVQNRHKIRTVFLNMILNEKICVDNVSFV